MELLLKGGEVEEPVPEPAHYPCSCYIPKPVNVSSKVLIILF